MKHFKFKREVISIIILLLAGISIGVIQGSYLNSSALMQKFATLSQNSHQPPEIRIGWQLYFHLVSHNISATFLTMVLFFLFGLGSILHILFMGYYLGIIFIFMLRFQTVVAFFAAILPHGVLEFPAIILSDAAGLYLGYAFLRKLFAKNHLEFRAAIKSTALFYIQIIIPLLLVAGLIEAFITPRILLSVEARQGHINPSFCHDQKSGPRLNFLHAYGFCLENK